MLSFFSTLFYNICKEKIIRKSGGLLENKIMEINYKIYVDLMRKKKVDKQLVKTYKLIYSLIQRGYINESYSLIRSLYEEILYELAITADHNYSITIKTEPKEIRNKVIDNIDLLFSDSIDDSFIKEIYKYLSKMTHETMIKELLKDMLLNKKLSSFMIVNSTYILLIIGYVFLNHIYIDLEEIELVDYLMIISTYVLMNETVKLNAGLTKDEINRYSNYFVDINDKQYVSKINEELVSGISTIDNNDFNNTMNEISKKTDELLKKYKYYNIVLKLLNQND